MKISKMLEKIRYAYWSIVPHRLRPGQLWYRFKCWAWHRHTTVKPRGLPHTWYDRSGLMPHMIFEILSQFIEGECGEDCHVDWYYEYDEDGVIGHQVEVGGEKVNVRDEMQDLYDWWHTDYLKNIDKIHDEWHEHRKLHVYDVFTRVTDPVTLDWVTEVDPNADAEELEEWGTQYSSPEAEVENERLFKEANDLEERYRVELNSRLHRVINIIPYMWT
jgi:hypothetical protein